MIRDCRAHHGIIVCPNGYTPAALRRAQDAIAIQLVPLSELERIDLTRWESCLGAACKSKPKRKDRGLVLYDSTFVLAVGGSEVSLVAVGKCDVCNNFHVWCWDCDEKFALHDEDMQKCSCRRFWLTAIENEVDNPEGKTIQAVHLLMVLLDVMIFPQCEPVVIPVDRRKLS